MFSTGYTQLFVESEQDFSEEFISRLGRIAFVVALIEYICGFGAFAAILFWGAHPDLLHWMVPAYILAAMVVEYIIFKMMFGQRIVFASLRWWCWYFVTLAPNYAQILGTMMVAAVCPRLATEEYDEIVFLWLFIAILIVCIMSALFHLALIAYWARAARRANNACDAGDAYDHLGEVFDSANLQFVAMAIRIDRGLAMQRSRLLTSIFLKTPVFLLKSTALTSAAMAKEKEDIDVHGEAYTMLQGVLLIGYGIVQLLPSFCRMARAGCLYCTALFVLVLLILLNLCYIFTSGPILVGVAQSA